MNTYHTTTGDSIRYGGRFRYLVVSRAWKSEWIPAADGSFDKSGFKRIYNEDGSRAVTDWSTHKRTDNLDTAIAAVRSRKLAGTANVEIIDTTNGRALAV